MTWEGGMREPALAWWPGTIGAGQVSEAMTSTMDIFPTALELTGQTVATDRVYDGRSLLPILKGDKDLEIRDTYFYYRGTTLYAVRRGPWKAHLITEWAYQQDNKRTVHVVPLLYNLEHDPSEQFDVAAAHPDVLDAITAVIETHQLNMVKRPTQLEAVIGK